MKIKISILLLFCNLYLLSQCNVKTIVPMEGFKNHSMSQILWDSTKSRPHSEGIDGYSIFVNNLVDGNGNKSLYNSIVISHIMVNYKDNEVPNKLTLILPSGTIVKKASTVQYDRLNIFSKASADTKTIECDFHFSTEEVKQIINEGRLYGIKIENYKTNKLLLSINESDIYSGQLSEMFKCVNFISLY